ncbi:MULTISPECIES: DUF2325 domain-containing protein [Acidovorax]|uniref:DUF2325 domain-containing protein n=1 Tax=Acidovorax facilis TaxID=12917 RepID=A0ABV8DJV4_9BURK|nr:MULTISPECIES: DUF2325 domain-containing protein [Acidovorax]KQB57133.1 hypothetical protein AE621_22345 [Acidovorax sp. SD340]MBO1009568.1 DUF2325 domain-containing protein [Acidovorax sp. SD340]MCO4243322.1 DUF2325 domain-containing protein [Acidovorax facilis]
MHSLPQEFLALCRQLGDVQKRCSATVAAQAAQIDALRAQVLRLRAEVIVRDTRLAMAQDALAQWKAAHPSLPRRKAMALHISVLVERIASLSRECLRWRLAVEAPAQSVQPEGSLGVAGHPSAAKGKGCAEPDAAPDGTLDANLAAADLVICQTGCISHDEYWRVQDHCRRTGKPCILVDQPLAVREAEALAAVQPMVVLRMTRAQRPVGNAQATDGYVVLDKNSL